jgi:alpha-1,2-mannosyltransferase
VWLPAVTFAVYGLTARWSRPFHTDAYGVAVEAWAWASRGAPWLEELPRTMLDTPQGPFPNWLFVQGEQHAVSSRTIGLVAAALPLSLFSREAFSWWPVTLTAVLLATLAVWFMHRCLRVITTPERALGGSLAFAFATPTWNVSSAWLLPHSLTQACIAAAAAAAARSRWWLVGLALGVGATGRAHLVVIAAAIGLGVAFHRRSASIAIAVGTPTCVGLLLVVLGNQWRYGDASIAGGYSSYAPGQLVETDAGAWVDYVVNVAGFLFSPGRGLFLWTPVALVLIPAAWRSRGVVPDWCGWLAIGGFAYTAVQLKLNHFGGGTGFVGYRHGLELLTAAFPLFVLAWGQIRVSAVRTSATGLLYLQFAMTAVSATSQNLYLVLSPVDAWLQHTLIVAILTRPVWVAVWAAVSILGAILIAQSGIFRPTGSRAVESESGPK